MSGGEELVWVSCVSAPSRLDVAMGSFIRFKFTSTSFSATKNGFDWLMRQRRHWNRHRVNGVVISSDMNGGNNGRLQRTPSARTILTTIDTTSKWNYIPMMNSHYNYSVILSHWPIRGAASSSRRHDRGIGWAMKPARHCRRPGAARLMLLLHHAARIWIQFIRRIGD